LQTTPTARKFFFSRFQNRYQYFLTAPVDGIEKVTAVAIVVLADTYNVIRFRKLLESLLNEYLNSKSCNGVLRPFLMSHAASITNKPTAAQQSEAKLALIAPVHLLIEQLGLDSIAIWSAVLTRHQVVFYHPDPEVLSDFVRAAGCFGGWHRQSWTLLRPVCTDSAAELADLKSIPGGFIAGFVQNTTNVQNIADVFIDLTRNTVVISDKAKVGISLSKYHKSVADSFVQALETVKAHNASADADNQQDPAQVILKQVMLKTKELLDQVAACKGEDGTVTRESIRSKEIPQSIENFVLAVAQAEEFGRK